MTAWPRPSPENRYWVEHLKLLRRSLRACTGRDLIEGAVSDTEAARRVFHAPFVLLSHNADADPIFTYGNLQALALFGVSWEQLTTMPSRLTAEWPERQERERLLAEVAAKGVIEDYSGIRKAFDGKRFRIQRATVWNLVDPNGIYRGQAATFQDWVAL